MKKALRDKIKKKLHSLKLFVIYQVIYGFFYKKKLNEGMLFLSCRDGQDLTGNIFRILKEVSSADYGIKTIIVWEKKKSNRKRFSEMCSGYGIRKVRFVSNSYIAIALMECAQFLVTDSSLPWEYVKREGQTVLNTWHGTPLKCMGKHIYYERAKLGTVQHALMSSDYCLYPNEYMRDIMLDDYMVRNIMSGKALVAGYPRNDPFFDDSMREKLRAEFGFTNKQVFAYMPTHRNVKTANNNEGQLSDVLSYLEELDTLLTDNQVFLVKLHIFNQSKIDFARYEHIFPFPDMYETYDVLNTADCLITDYSSVFFDFANTRRKIILFTYDRAEYFENRGVYFELEEMPFPIANTLDELWIQMNCPKHYDDTAFVEKFCKYDNISGAKRLCEFLFKGEGTIKPELVGNNKKTLLFFGGSMAKNGITTALLGLLKSLDKSKYNVYVSFWRNSVINNPERIDQIPGDVDYIPLMCDPIFTLGEKIAYRKFCRNRKADQPITKAINNLFERERRRLFTDAKIDYLIQFDGYGVQSNLLFSEFGSVKKTIFVHSDMVKEIASNRGNQHPALLRKMYREYDRVAIVSPKLREPTEAISGRSDNIVVVHNIDDNEGIFEKCEQPIEFQKNTSITCFDPRGVEGVLEGEGFTFISIGRFSKEKGHDRLIAAFDRFCSVYPESTLIIIGGHGNLYNYTLKKAANAKHWKNIIIIKSMDNPLSILNRCDLFILSSLYEGMPMTIKEADILHIPIVATDIPGVSEYLLEHGGYVCQNNEEGLYQGMIDFADGKINPMCVNYEKANYEAMKEFYHAIGEEIG